MSDTLLSQSVNMEQINKKAIEYIEDITANADEVQRRILAEILSRNAHVEYLERHGLAGHTDRDTFKKIIPVITYQDIQPDINRIVHGDFSPILCSEPISEFLASSGTTSNGEGKMIPTIAEETERKAQLTSVVMRVISQYFPGLDKGKGMHFMFVKAETKTPGGLMARTVVTSYYKKSNFMDRTDELSIYNKYTSPKESIFCRDSFQSMYSQLLCGLYQNMQVLRIGSVFASGLVRAFQFLEKHWPLLCTDIRSGTLNPQITDPSVREAVLRILKPDPELADFVEAECSNKSWKGIVTKLWPNAKYVDTIVTGSMSQYVPTLDYYCNGLPLVSIGYGSSECFFGVNLNPLSEPSEISYTLMPTMAYFEFLPVHRNSQLDQEQQDLVDLVDVKLGQEYELVVTTYTGLYRYKVGDVLRVAGFKNKAPQFNFICRTNVGLSIDTDKTDEADLQNAVNNAVNHLKPFGAMLLEYTSCTDTSTSPGHYVMFWELSHCSTPIPASVFEDCCLTIEESLNSMYREGRTSDKTIGPLEIKIVEAGTFDKLMDYAISRGSSISQYKTPRCVKYGSIVELLNSRAVNSYFSPKCPKWIPGHKEWYVQQQQQP